MLNRLRPALSHIVTPIGKALAKIGATPNVITVTGTLGVSAGALAFYPQGELFWGTVFIGAIIAMVVAIPLGLWLGRKWGELFMASIDQETFRWAVTIAPRTYWLAAMVAFLAAAASALGVRRNLDKLDLIGVLKTRE